MHLCIDGVMRLCNNPVLETNYNYGDTAMIFEPNLEELAKIGTLEQRSIWSAALRSGDYEQHRESMCDANNPKSACCLHVAAMVVDGVDWSSGVNLLSPQAIDSALFAQTAEDYGIGAAEFLDFALLNDHHGLTFPQIADYADGITVDTEAAKWVTA